MYIDILKKTLLDRDNLAFNFEVLNSDNFDTEALYEFLNSISMFDSAKIILLDDLNYSKMSDKEIEFIISMIEDIPENTYLFIKQTENLFFPEKKKKLKKTLQAMVDSISKNGAVTVLNERTESGLINFIIKTVNSHNKKIEPANARLIIEKVGTQMNLISNEVLKLISFSDGEIKREDIETLCTVNIETTAFYLVNDLVSGKTEQALLKLHYLVDYMHLDEIFISGAIFSSFCDIYRVFVTKKCNRTYSDLTSVFPSDYKNRSFKLTNAEKIARKYNKNQILKILNLLSAADYELKSFNFSSKLVLEKLIVKIGLINAEN